MTHDKNAVRKILDQAKAAKREALTAPEARGVCEAYGIAIPKEGVAKTAEGSGQARLRLRVPRRHENRVAADSAQDRGGGVIVGVKSAEAAKDAYAAIVGNAKKYDAKGRDPRRAGSADADRRPGSHHRRGDRPGIRQAGRLRARRHPGRGAEGHHLPLGARHQRGCAVDARWIAAAEILRGVRGAKPVHRAALAGMIEKVSTLVADFPEISEMDLNPVFATEQGATAADVRIVLNFNPAPARDRPSQAAIVEKMTRIMKPKALAVIGASAENGKIGNSVMKN